MKQNLHLCIQQHKKEKIKNVKKLYNNKICKNIKETIRYNKSSFPNVIDFNDTISNDLNTSQLVDYTNEINSTNDHIANLIKEIEKK